MMNYCKDAIFKKDVIVECLLQKKVLSRLSILGAVYSLLSIFPLFVDATLLGGETSYTTNGQTVQFAMQNGTMNITVCTQTIIRVWCTPGKTFGNKDFTAVSKGTWAPVSFTVTESSGQVQVATSAIAVSVNKATGAIAYTDLSGSTIALNSGNDMAASTAFPDAPYSFTTPFTIAANEAIYGLGEYENDSSVTYNGRNVTLYPQQYTSVYTVPLAVSSKGYGILWDNSLWSIQWQQNNTIMNVHANSSPFLDYYFIYGPAIDSVVSGYRLATGKAPLFGKWAYGYIQSKCQYNSQAEILSVAAQFRIRKIPVDLIVQDWNWWTKCGSHIFNSNYPNPANMNDSLHKMNFHVMLSVWPAFDTTGGGSANSNELQSAGCLLASDFNGEYFDPFNTTCDSIYWRQIKDLIMPLGFDAFWHDASEGAMYQNLDWRSPEYSYVQCKTTFEGQRSYYNGSHRIFTLTRSAWAGQQQSATVVWSGDIDSSWNTLKKQIPVGINFCMSGMPYWCNDIGGYWTGCTPETMVRWFQFGTFCPMLRVHGVAAKEPWNWDAATEATLIAYIKLRYRLMPYIYSLAWMVTDLGYTMMRGLIMDFQSDQNVQKISSQYMFGTAFMVNPVTTPGSTSRQVYLPSTKWYNFWTGTSVNGGATITVAAPLDTIPLYVRAGSIVPMGPELQYATEKPADTIELRVYPGANGNFTLYEDENDNYNYEQGKYATIPITYIDNPQNVIIGDRSGSFTGMDQKKIFNIVYVKSNHGIGEGQTVTHDCQLMYTGIQVSCSPVRIRQSGTAALSSSLRLDQTLKTASNRVVFDGAFAGIAKSVVLYDLNGKLVAMKIIKTNGIDLRKDFGIRSGVYIVKVRTLQ
jgi:alpha-D-xyloside xylohydrolase